MEGKKHLKCLITYKTPDKKREQTIAGNGSDEKEKENQRELTSLVEKTVLLSLGWVYLTF